MQTFPLQDMLSFLFLQEKRQSGSSCTIYGVNLSYWHHLGTPAHPSTRDRVTFSQPPDSEVLHLVTSLVSRLEPASENLSLRCRGLDAVETRVDFTMHCGYTGGNGNF